MSERPSRKELWRVLALYIFLHFANTLLLKWLARHGVSTFPTLFYRGLGCIVIGVISARLGGKSLRPNEPMVQAYRLGLAGFSLMLVTASFQYANAATVSLLSRLDTALLLVIAPWIGVRARPGQRLLATASVASLFGIALFLRGPQESLLGYALAFAGTIGLTAGYLLLRSSTRSENGYVIAVVGGIAILGFGMVGGWWTGRGPLIPWWCAAGGLAAGACMFYIYQYTVRLYRCMDITLAEYPTLVAAMLVLPAEWLFFGTQFSTPYVLAMVGNTLALGACLWWGRKG